MDIIKGLYNHAVGGQLEELEQAKSLAMHLEEQA